jgi:hypothetical protein
MQMLSHLDVARIKRERLFKCGALTDAES